MNESQWISKIQKAQATIGAGVIVGIGDDAAVLKPLRDKMVVTTDSLIEGVHFDFKYSTPLEVGKKALAVNLSDLASMGALPRFALVSLALPSNRAETFIPDFYRGLRLVARHFPLSVVGGNLSGSLRDIFVDITLIGESQKPLLRSGARPGDWIGHFGPLGEAAAGLALLKKHGRSAMRRWPRLCRAQLTPFSRNQESSLLVKRATACIDVSDGLATELHHIAKASKVAMLIDAEAIRFSKELLDAAQSLRCDPLKWALYGGEDYALLFTAPPKTMSVLHRLGATPIGTVVGGKADVRIFKEGKTTRLSPRGFDHFSLP